MSYALLLLVAGLVGFLSLSFEILFFRILSHVTGGTAPAFGILLAYFLLGLALGSLGTHLFCTEKNARGSRRHLWLPAFLTLAGCLAGYLTAPAFAAAVRGPGFVRALPVVSLTAGLLGAVLPLVSHLAVAPDSRAGSGLSYVYLANILGSAGGSVLTGFVLLDVLPLSQLAALLLASGVVLSTTLFLLSVPRSAWIAIPAALALLYALPRTTAVLYEGLWEKLQYKSAYRPGLRFTEVVENRSGVITVDAEGSLYGGGVYDGAFSTDLVHDRNGVFRPYALAALHPEPRDVLLIGLASGSWAQVLAHHPSVRRLTVLEINPGYLSLIARHSEVRSLLSNPRVEIVLNDARRWLVSNPDRKFDAVYQNASWHWRGHSTLLLSEEYLRMLRKHLKPGGVFLSNVTSSLDAAKTACTVFPHGFRLGTNMVVSDEPVALDRVRWEAALRSYRIDGRPVLDLARDEDRAVLAALLGIGPSTVPGKRGRTRMYEPCESVLYWTRPNGVITDDNMLTEWYRPWTALPR